MIEFLGHNTWVAIVFTGLVGLIGTMVAVSTQRSINRRRATVDMFSNKLWDEDYIKVSNIFYTAMKDQTKLMQDYDLFIQARNIQQSGKWADVHDAEKKKFDDATLNITSVRSILNDRELIAIGVREGTYDEVIYRRWWYSTALLEWRSASPLVARIRSDTQVGPSAYAYTEMENLAKRWQAEGPWRRADRHVRLPGGRTVTISRSR